MFKPIIRSLNAILILISFGLFHAMSNLQYNIKIITPTPPQVPVKQTKSCIWQLQIYLLLCKIVIVHKKLLLIFPH